MVLRRSRRRACAPRPPGAGYTLTGVAERAHLAHGGVNLDTHITDVLAALAAEPDAERLVLVGHSYGGMVITGVADRIPDRVDALVYPRRGRAP